MAVYTEVSDEELARFLAAYEIGPLLSMKGIAEGVENSNFLLRTGGGSFILTLYEKRVAAGDLPFFIALMEHLAAHGLDCPQPVKTREGSALGRLAGRPAAMVTFLEGLSVAPTDAGALRGGRRRARRPAQVRRRLRDGAGQRAVAGGLGAVVRARAVRRREP